MSHPARPAASIRAQGAVRSFPESGVVVDRVSLDIRAGEFVALLGPSGCGKSTFLRMAAGLDQPDAGKLDLGSGAERGSRGFVFQESHLLPWRTALRNVMLPLELLGIPKKDALERARSALSQVGLDGSVESKFPLQLSGGMKMRVSVARALVTEPPLLLLDEPFSALDENARHSLQGELRSLWERKPTTILFVTHSVAEATYLANRIIVFSKRPARVLLDHAVALPEKRHGDLRTDPAFTQEMRRIYKSVSIQEAPL
jgi:NitT/TauT family transport system ATP-binding protein